MIPRPIPIRTFPLALCLAGCVAGEAQKPTTVAVDSIDRCQIVVVGGSTAAFTATLAAARAGATVCLAQPTDRYGGQFTTQALPASDDGKLAGLPATSDHLAGESFAFSASQRRFRALERSLQPLGGAAVDNPGRCWVGDVCTRPDTAAAALTQLLQPYLDAGQVRVLDNLVPAAVTTAPSAGGRRRVVDVLFHDAQGGPDVRLAGDVFVEATDLGDLLELGGIESVVGQEARSQTGEAPLPDTACPTCQQSFTFDIAVERTAAGAGVPVAAPPGYGVDPWLSGYTSTFWAYRNGAWISRSFFTDYSLFDYRRAEAEGSRGGAVGDVSILDWGCQVQGPTGVMACGNDYRGGVLLGVSAEERQRQLGRARDRAVGYLYFLQRTAASNLAPRGDLTGTSDGVAPLPYVREARRGVALRTIVHQDLAASAWRGACSAWPASDPLSHAQCRGIAYPDSVGIGQYHYFDLHGNDAPGQVLLTGDDLVALPYTVPLSALVPVATDGLVLSSKSIGTTHITNAAYRLHPAEWAIGEASGAAAAWAVLHHEEVRDLAQSPSQVAGLQASLADAGVPLYWFDDVAVDDPDFAAIQMLAAAALVVGDSLQDLHFRPEETISRAMAADALVKTLGLPLSTPSVPTFSDVPTTHWAYATIETAVRAGIVHGYPDGRFEPDAAVERLHFGYMVANAAPDQATAAFAGTPRDAQPMRKRELSRVLNVLYRHRVGS